MSEEFFASQKEQSHIKSLIVRDFFTTWASIITSAQNRAATPEKRAEKIGYLDLFSGKGVYDDNSPSTPILVMQKVLANPVFSSKLCALFCDENPDHLERLKEHIETLPGYSSLRHPPEYYPWAVDERIQKILRNIRYPCFFFIDPFGYKGLTLNLINSVMNSWGSDCMFFFNYRRIHQLVENGKLGFHLKQILTEEGVEKLKIKFSKKPKPNEREKQILEALNAALTSSYGGKGRLVLPIRFRNPQDTLTSHHLVFVTKHFLGYDKMKEVMRKHSSDKANPVTLFEFVPDYQPQPTLFSLTETLEDLARELPEMYTGQKINFWALYQQHSVGRRFLLPEYSKVLRELEKAGKISIDRPPGKPKSFMQAKDVTIIFEESKP